ncbi:DnaA regulatory inactivator Hda [Stenotrophomonas panacihumi]|uniref:DnaA regulatory inactivator Hda n=1 Tax=Stenotrophomonas panacihumi TaxID=676599 RepID=A0A0R0ANV2_9GAMM|nr:DnaA regulatory inactivator Hda [Stenotrophomonas panacihumi]KRG46966.1 DnaA regulatory inactivator Hda [Stenotrophomonas panacihumi]PTN54197.1 DnaA regulatory inactivator Hda [Stenotrophomonas panacihumi]
MSVPQLPLALRYPPDQRLETYVGAPEGVIAQLRAIAIGARADWIFLAGPAGSGKTHLALSLCAAAEQAGRRAAYLPLVAAAGRLREALESLEGHEVIALDGLDVIAGQREDEVALFDFHNRARAAGVVLLYTARAMPDGLPLGLPDLRSRLSQCVRIGLPALDDAGRTAVLRERAQRRGLVIDDAAIEWLLTHSGRDLAGLVALLDRLDRESLAAKRRITVPFLRSVL